MPEEAVKSGTPNESRWVLWFLLAIAVSVFALFAFMARQVPVWRESSCQSSMAMYQSGVERFSTRHPEADFSGLEWSQAMSLLYPDYVERRACQERGFYLIDECGKVSCTVHGQVDPEPAPDCGGGCRAPTRHGYGDCVR